MTSTAGILVVAAQRELRRALFDTFDRDGHFVVHSARDATHAGILLEGRPPLALIVIVFEGDGREGMAGIDVLRGVPACVGAPILAVLDDAAVLKPNVLPAAIADWLYASQIEHELLSRWQRVHRMVARQDSSGEGVATSSGGDYRFAFDEVDSESIAHAITTLTPHVITLLVDLAGKVSSLPFFFQPSPHPNC